MKIDWNNKKSKKALTITGYALCVLIIGIIIILIDMMIYFGREECVEIQMAELNTVERQEGENIGTYKVEIVDYSQLSYYIKVNCREQTVTVYTTDENDEYTVPIKTMICSTGTATPNKGTYAISDKYEWRDLVGNVYGQYATRITGQILFHSVPYTKKDKSTLEYWEYDKLGEPASKGCVRLTVEDAKWIYDYCKRGTRVEFCEEETEGLEEKNVSSKKISEYSEELRSWDPTDPDEDNPWLNYETNIDIGE